MKVCPSARSRGSRSRRGKSGSRGRAPRFPIRVSTIGRGTCRAREIPGRTVLRIEADNDFAYAATDSGAARFDSYTLEWEALRDASGRALGPASDLAVAEDRVWFALETGVAEYRKESESLQIDADLGGFAAPRVLALRQTTRYLWAVTAQGLSRYDKLLRSWTSFRAGVELPDARVHQVSLDGEDIWIGTDDGLWRYRADIGLWRRDESADGMPGRQVRAFALEPDRISVVTEEALALYEKDAARWLDFTADVAIAAPEVGADRLDERGSRSARQ